LIAALYVEARGVYAGRPGVDLWDAERDARKYAGPFPVVAHPPCVAWCRLAGFREALFGLPRGEDGGCFAAALAAVRTWGGVLEHPAHSAAWAAHGLTPPGRGGWYMADFRGGWACEVHQERYGHPARKATWLYAHGVDLPSLDWKEGKATTRWGTHRAHVKSKFRGHDGRPTLTPTQSKATPPAFAKLLLGLAGTARNA